jgi:hypothetical protein
LRSQVDQGSQISPLGPLTAILERFKGSGDQESKAKLLHMMESVQEQIRDLRQFAEYANQAHDGKTEKAREEIQNEIRRYKSHDLI